MIPKSCNAPYEELSEYADTIVYGSVKYTDYDGIGTSLSPRAGHILGRPLPDVIFSGHRHMNEAGVMFIMPGELIIENSEIDVTHPDIIKIVGRPVRQLASPFNHLDSADFDGDGHDELIVTADNDLCAGLNSGAVYVLNGGKIVDGWQKLKSRHMN